MVPPKRNNLIKSIGRLDSSYEIRRACARLANHVLKREITPQMSSSINGLLQTAIKCLEIGDFSDALLKLEKSVKKMKKKRR